MAHFQNGMQQTHALKMSGLSIIWTNEELISKTSYIHSYMLLICSSGHSKKANCQFSTHNLLQMESVDTNWNLE